jgi:two-component system response regulator PilR (NtrC family)
MLRMQNYKVTSAGTVADALAEITSAQFDVLITDLNISYPAGGLIVVSTMRNTQPNCVTLILTGDSGVETALEEIENKVDGYLIKPVPIPTLVSLIEEKLKQRTPGTGAATKRIA